MLSNWYTDNVDIYRIASGTEGNLDVQRREKVNRNPIPCRVYRTAIQGANIQDTAAVVRKEDKLACAVDVDIRTNDELIVTRGGRIGGTTTERYIAGKPQFYYDPVGSKATGIAHQEIGLLADNIVGA